jgi:hypothetical protein
MITLSLVDDLPFDQGRVRKLRDVIEYRRKRLTPT